MTSARARDGIDEDPKDTLMLAAFLYAEALQECAQTTARFTDARTGFQAMVLGVASLLEDEARRVFAAALEDTDEAETEKLRSLYAEAAAFAKRPMKDPTAFNALVTGMLKRRAAA